MDIEFGSEGEFQEMQEERERKLGPITDGATVQIKMVGAYNKSLDRRDRVTGYTPQTTKKDGTPAKAPFFRIQWEVINGEFAGKSGSNFVAVDQGNAFFRQLFKVATGEDLSGGGKFKFEEFSDALVSGIFEVRAGAQRPREGEKAQYSEAKWFLARVGEVERDDAPDPDLEIGGAGADIDDGNVPF